MQTDFAAGKDKFINTHQVGGILEYTINNGEARGLRICEVNTGGGLRYRILLDRGMDIDHAFMYENSLSFLSHKNVTPPTRALDAGLDWLKGFPGGLLTSCGPFNTGGPAKDAGETLGLHGQHSNTAAEVESVVQPDVPAGQMEMSVTGLIRYGAFYGPNLTLRRTIRSTIGQPSVQIEDVFSNRGNHPVPHAWLLHINFGYPLLDEGTEYLIDYTSHSPRNDPLSQDFFSSNDGRRFPAPSADQSGDRHVFRYLDAVAKPDGSAKATIWNQKLSLGVRIDYSMTQFPRLGQWMHWGRQEYVSAIEPMSGGVEGRDVDRKLGWLRMIEPGKSIEYKYAMTAITDRQNA